MPNVPGGYQPDTKSESSRRADFDLLKRLKIIERSLGGSADEVWIGNTTPPDPATEIWLDTTSDPPVLKAKVDGVWTVVSTGGGGGTGTDEVWVGITMPTDPALELWYDPDATAGSGGDLGMTFNQGIASAVWTIVHPLTFQPNVSVVDSSGTQVEGNVEYLTPTTVRITFSAAFAGTAYLS